jgi:hypothetical protein
MPDRLKVLDCNRKSVLSLPDGAFKVWFCRYMNEDEENESWISLPGVEAQTGMSHPTNVKWHQFLVSGGWLVDTGKTAADKLMALGKTPSKGSYQCPVYRVDDPTRKKIELEEKPICTGKTIQLKNLTSSKNEHKVLGIGSCSSSSSGYESPSLSLSTYDSCPAGREVQKILEKQNQEPHTNTHTNGSRKSLAPNGMTWKAWDTHGPAWKASEHARCKGGAGTQGKQKDEPTKTDIWLQTCCNGELGCERKTTKRRDGRYFCSECWTDYLRSEGARA